MTEREPSPAVQVQRGAYAGLGARGPEGFDSGPAGCITKVVAMKIIAQKIMVQRATAKQSAR
jgi:hypothetical protein